MPRAAAACEETLGKQIEEADTKLTRYYLTVLASAALGFILLMAGKPTLSRSAVVVLMLFCISMLAGGVLSPMLEVEVRVTKLDATLLGTPIEFRDQSLYYRSKTVLEVFQTLIQMGRPEMTLVGVLVILFSVVFPALKMLALGACLFRPALLRTNRFVKLLAFELSKWSMADVMVLAIFMSFVAFNGVIGSALGRLARRAERPTSADPDGCFQDPARLLLVHWFLRVEHLPVEETGARDRFQFHLRINLDSPAARKCLADDRAAARTPARSFRSPRRKVRIRSH